MGQVEDSAIPNTFAYIALFGWPLVCIGLFAMLRVEAAAIWSILAGYLLLPSATSVDVALLPSLDKFSIPAISAFLLCWMKGTRTPAPARSPLIYCLAFCYVLAPLLTSLGNSYEVQQSGISLRGFYPLDGVKFGIRNLIAIAPFFIGMRFLSTDHARALLLRSLLAAVLLYSLPMLFEIRMSPQLHYWVYGFFPHSFIQMARDGGFRPVVFLRHGLEVALLACSGVIAAVIATKLRWRVLHIPASVAAPYLAIVLLLCKSMASIIYATIFAPVVLLTGPKTWVKAACVILVLFCAYPLLRNYDLIPVHRALDLSKAISVERSASFQTRVENEDILLAKANEKPMFGWGAWGRSRVYDEKGNDISITDGGWIIEFGSWGWFGYLSFFGLFAAAAFRARSAVAGPVTQSKVVLGGLSLILAINVFDLIPNGFISPFTLLAAGSIAGCVRVRAARSSPSMRRRLGSADARLATGPAVQ